MHKIIVCLKSARCWQASFAVLLLLGIGSGNFQPLLAQSTFSIPNHQLAHVEPTEDGGFMAYSFILPSGHFCYMKFDSNAVFQYGYEAEYAQTRLLLASRNGKLFTCLNGGPHSFVIAKIDIATGVMERAVHINCPEGLQDYLNLGPSRLFATQDGGLIVVPGKDQCQEIVSCLMCHFKFDSNLDLVYLNGTSFGTLSTVGSTSPIAENPDGSIVRGGSLNLGPANNVSFVLRHDAATGAVLNQFLFKDSITVPVAQMIVSDTHQVLLVSSIYAGDRGAVMSLPHNLSGPNWYRHYATTTGNQTLTGFAADHARNSYVGGLNDVVFGMDLNGQILWKGRSPAVTYHTSMSPMPHGRTACLIPYGLYNRIEVLDSMGLGICDTGSSNITIVPAGTLPTPSTAFSTFYNVAQVDTVPLLIFTPLTVNPQTECSYACTIEAAFTAQNCDLQTQFYSAAPQATTHDWDFGDGNTGSGQSPTHTYATPGTYTVCYIATTACMADTACQSITVAPASVAAAYTVSGSYPTFAFQDLSTGSPTSWLWDFGDGGTSTAQSPSHTYAAPGTYFVCLTAILDCKRDTSCQPLTVVSAGPAQMENAFYVYPSPATDRLYIRQASGKLDPVAMTVFAASGRIVYTASLLSDAMTIDLQDWAAGIYFLEASSLQGRWRSKFVVVR